MIVAAAPLLSSQFLGAYRVADPIPTRARSSKTRYRYSPVRISASSAHVPSAERSLVHVSSSLYDVLGISLGATGADIKAAYRRLVRTCHPDVAAGDSSAEDFIRIHAAYSTLSDPDKRAEYDRAVLARWPVGTAFSSSAYTSRGLSRRTWETDQCW